MLLPTDIQKFREIYSLEFGVSLTNDQATVKANECFGLFKIILNKKFNRKKDENEKKDQVTIADKAL